MEKENQEFLFKLGIFEQQIRQIQQQINAVEEGIVELGILNLGLDDLKNSDGKEMLAPVGRGIFVKSKIISEELTVDIGQKTFVKKSIPQTQEVIKEQLERLEEAKMELNNNLEEIGRELENVMKESQK